MTVSGDNGHGQRKRRAHQKSRRGCRNCKLRRVKCDESRPGCTKCSSFGVSCNYGDPNAPDLQTAYNGMASRSPTRKVPPQSASPMESSFFVGKVRMSEYLRPRLTRLSDDGYSAIELDSESMGRMHRFITRTVFSVGPPDAAVMFQAEISELMCGYPYLMHMVQAITALHDRILSPNPDPQQTRAELYHASRAAALFNAKLSQPLQQDDRDPLWATAALLGVAAMSWMEAGCAEEAWPLTVREPTDLDWIRISRSKVAVWELTDPMRVGSRFRRVVEEQKRNELVAKDIISKMGIDELPSKLLAVCEIDEYSSPETHPYLTALKGLAHAMAVESVRANLLILLSFIGRMGDDFQRLLRERDPRALLLMAYWYAKIKGTMWWLDRRSILEGQAICLYLERYHADDTEIMSLLSYPKMRLGLSI